MKNKNYSINRSVKSIKSKNMKKKILTATALFIAIFAISSSQMFAQEVANKSNGTLEIVSIDIPDSIVVKYAEGQAINRKIDVSLVYNKQTFLSKKIIANPIVVKEDKKGAWSVIYTDATKFCAKDFDISDANIKIQKIKFVVAGKATYYNLETSEWEPKSKKK